MKQEKNYNFSSITFILQTILSIKQAREQSYIKFPLINECYTPKLLTSHFHTETNQEFHVTDLHVFKVPSKQHGKIGSQTNQINKKLDFSSQISRNRLNLAIHLL